MATGDETISTSVSGAGFELPTAPPAPRPTAQAPAELWPTIVRAAWMAILLGLAIEVLLVVLALGAGAAAGPKPIAADVAQKVSWSLLVCVGLAFGGTAAAKARGPVMGLLGLISAPLAFNVARLLHKGIGQALSIATAGAPAVPVVLIALVKALEYGILGSAIGWIGRRPGSGLTAHAVTGLAIGLTFGAGLVWLTSFQGTAHTPLPDLLAKSINEILFPVGCSLVLFAAGALGKRLPA